MLAHHLNPLAPNLGLPASEPVGTGSSTVTTGSNTITNVPGGVSTSNLYVASTSAFEEIPGRIYITFPPSTQTSGVGQSALLPLAALPLLGIAAGARRRWRARHASLSGTGGDGWPRFLAPCRVAYGPVERGSAAPDRAHQATVPEQTFPMSAADFGPPGLPGRDRHPTV